MPPNEPTHAGNDADQLGPGKHIMALDGLRGVAVLTVLVHHFFPYRPTDQLAGKVLNGVVGLSWSGVDLFFVLSGFLITGILYDSKSSEHYFRNFYARRTLRIFPLYYGALVLFFLVLPLVGISRAAPPSGESWWWWLYLSNIRRSFFPHDAEGCLTHFWSLAVEEHFYLVWPLVIWSLSRSGAIRASTVCIAIAWISRGAFIAADNAQAPFALTPCRLDALATGALIALTARHAGGMAALVPYARTALPVAGILTLGVAVWTHSVVWNPVMQVVGLPLVSVFYGAALVTVVTAPQGGWVRALLESRVLRTFGKYSYGIYVFHVAVGALAEWCLPAASHSPFPPPYQRANDTVRMVGLIAASFALAFVSWHLFERHFLRLKSRFESSGKGSAGPSERPI